MIDQDAEIFAILNTIGPGTVKDLQQLAKDDPSRFFRALAKRPDLAGLTTSLANSDSPELARLRLLRAISDHLGQD
jgi:hypothetical protein